MSSSCLHNLRDFGRIAEIYGKIQQHVKPGGAFLNLDLINAPTAELQERYVRAAGARREREGTSGQAVEAMVSRGGRPRAAPGGGPFPGSLDQHLAALRESGFTDVDCFWKELRRALFGGYG